MKQASTILAALLLWAATGCETPDQPEDTADFDREIDGPPCVYAAGGDEDLLADQGKLAERRDRQAAAAAASAAPPAAPQPARLPAGADPVQSLRQRLQALALVASAGKPEQMIELFGAEEANALRQMLAVKDIETKLQSLEQLVRTRFGDASAGKIKALFNAGGPAGAPGTEPAAGPPRPSPPKADDIFGPLMDTSKLQFEAQGETVVVTQPDGEKITFIYTDQDWKIQADPLLKQMMVLGGKMAVASGKLVDALAAGINDGSINQGNLEAKAQELAETHLAPAMEQFAKLFGEMMKKAFEGMGKAAPPGPTTQPAGTTPPAPKTPKPPDVSF